MKPDHKPDPVKHFQGIRWQCACGRWLVKSRMWNGTEYFRHVGVGHGKR